MKPQRARGKAEVTTLCKVPKLQHSQVGWRAIQWNPRDLGGRLRYLGSSEELQVVLRYNHNEGSS